MSKKQSKKRRLRHKFRVAGEIYYTYRGYIVMFFAFLCLLLILFGYMKWLNYQSFTQLKKYIKETVEASGETAQSSKEEKLIRENIAYTDDAYAYLDVQAIAQKPELPTGCEVTSLAILLNYLHPEKETSKVILSDKYLETGRPGSVSPDEKFVGNPHSDSGFGANASVLVKTANKYLADHMKESGETARNLTGTEFRDLLRYVSDGYPVMIWATINLLEPYTSVIWTIDGEEIPWQAQFHCMVLTGFDFGRRIYYAADPWNGEIMEYSMDLLELRYDQLGKQAVVIY